MHVVKIYEAIAASVV